jgi:hypothetical protein
MGRFRSERVSERKRAANRANASKPRGRWAGTPERAGLEEGKRLLREAIPEGAAHIADLIRNPETPAELRLQAFKLAADRAGLPVLTESEVRAEGPSQTITMRLTCPECGRDHNMGLPPPLDTSQPQPVLPLLEPGVEVSIEVALKRAKAAWGSEARAWSGGTEKFLGVRDGDSSRPIRVRGRGATWTKALESAGLVRVARARH